MRIFVAAIIALVACLAIGVSSVAGQAAPTPTATPACDASYPDFCIPPPPPDLNCLTDITQTDFTVLPPDRHDLDRDGDGLGCDSEAGPATATQPPPQPTATSATAGLPSTGAGPQGGQSVMWLVIATGFAGLALLAGSIAVRARSSR
jgi:hypothetical protein